MTYGDYPVAVKYITAAIKSAEKRVEVCSGGDEILWKGRPAIREFMTSLVNGEGQPRRPSSLMISACEAGLRVGLCDDDVDGWVWREDITLSGALDAIEKTLSSGKVQWSKKGGWKGKKR